MKNDKVMIRTLSGLGVDSATIYLDYLVNKNKDLTIAPNNRSTNAAVTGQLFKTIYINNAEDRNALGVDQMRDADRDAVKNLLYQKYLKVDKPLKIVACQYKPIDYDYIFSEFYRIDISPSADCLVKLMIIYFQKFACQEHDAYEKNLNGDFRIIPFYDYKNEVSVNPVQAKLKSIIKDRLNGKHAVIPLLATYFAEQNVAETDYDKFFTNAYFRLKRFTNVKSMYATDAVIDANSYLFDSSRSSLDRLTETFTDCFDEAEFNEVLDYNKKKVEGNLKILDAYKYDSKVEQMGDDDKIAWLMSVCVPIYEKYKSDCGYK